MKCYNCDKNIINNAGQYKDSLNRYYCDSNCYDSVTGLFTYCLRDETTDRLFKYVAEQIGNEIREMLNDMDLRHDTEIYFSERACNISFDIIKKSLKKRAKNNENISVFKLDINKRAIGTLKLNNIYSTDDLKKLDLIDLSKIPDFGRKSLRELDKALIDRGIVLSDEKNIRARSDY